MKAVAGELPVSDVGWAYETKWDGYRTLAFVVGSHVALQSSNLIDVTRKWPSLAAIAEGVNATGAVLDGEVVCFDENGASRFEWLQQGKKPVTFVIFDVLNIDGHDITGLPFEQRRALLEQLVEPGPNWLVSPLHTGPGSGAALAEATKDAGAEGIIAKRLDSLYVPGKRSPSWRKIKHRRVQEFVVGGYTTGSGARESTFGSIAVGFHEHGRLVFAGTAGSGFTQNQLDESMRWFEKHPLTECPFDPKPPRDVVKTSRWTQPLRVAQVAFAEWTTDRLLRHPVFLGWRDDKDPADVTSEP